MFLVFRPSLLQVNISNTISSWAD